MTQKAAQGLKGFLGIKFLIAISIYKDDFKPEITSAKLDIDSYIFASLRPGIN